MLTKRTNGYDFPVLAGRRTLKPALSLLLVEDDSFLLEALASFLARQGYDVTMAADGNAAMQLARQQLPNIAVIDMLLPGQSGFLITQQLKEHSAGTVYVVMMSGNSAAPHRDYARAVGVDWFLAKPFSIAQLVEALEGFCQFSQAPSMQSASRSQSAAIPA